MGTEYDVAVIGAGVVGCAIAERITAQHPQYSVIVIERHAEVGREASRTNSGVIHSGLHLRPDSRKARLARRGSALVRAWCTAHGVPMRQCGMHVVVAPGDLLHLWGELRGFCALLFRARAQHIPIAIRSGRRIRRDEPAIRCLFGIAIPEVVIIDAIAFVRSLAAAAMACNTHFAFGESVIGTVIDGRQHVVTTTAREIRARAVVNAAGIGAVALAAEAGFSGHRVTLYRGEYYEVMRPELQTAVHGLVYPVYRPGSPGLGIHCTPTMDGRLLLGPNARRIDGPEDIDHDRTPPDAFLAAVRPFFPDLTGDDLRFAYAGIRTKRDDGTREPDFHLGLDRVAPPFVNCIGIESPGLTAAMAIAEEVVALLASR